nr:glycosyltransferase family 4 protein [Pseudomonadota bacterium]
MRVVFVLAGLGAGGAEKVVNLLAHHRLAAGDDVHVIALNATDATSYFSYDPRIQVEGLTRTGKNSRHFVTMQRVKDLRRRFARIRPDMVVSFLTKINVITVLATAGTGTPTIISERNNFDVQQMSRFWRWSRPMAAFAATSVVVMTERARARQPARVRKKTIVIPNPVTPLPRAMPRPDAGRRVVAVGRLDRQKGFDILIASFAQVVERVPDAVLTIYGEGPERSALEKQISDLGLQEAVRLSGVTQVPGEWVSPGDVFALSSRFEGFANVVLEAMSSGMAVVSVDCPWGPSEIVQDGTTGLLVPMGSKEALATAITRVLTDPELRGSFCEAGPPSLDRFSTATVLAKWDETISQAAGRPPLTVFADA